MKAVNIGTPITGQTGGGTAVTISGGGGFLALQRW